MDFHFWTLRDGVNLVPNIYNYLFDKRLSYIPLASFDWAFYVHAGGVGCSVIAFALASRLAAVVLSTTVPRTSPKEDKAPLALVPLNIQYEDLTKTTPAASVADENEDDLNEVEKQPHFNDGNKSETTLHEES